MKKLTLVVLLAGGFLPHSASAQLKVNPDVNIGTPPLWGPTGYDHAEYYYLPEYDVYYDVLSGTVMMKNIGRSRGIPTTPNKGGHDHH